MRMNGRIAQVAVTLLVVSLVGWWLWSASRNTIEAQGVVAVPAVQVDKGGSNLPLRTPIASSAPASVSPSAPGRGIVTGDWTSAYTSRDPYPAMVALREARQKGSFAASYELQQACLLGLISISRPPNAYSTDPSVPDEYLQARIQARQEIEARCIRFSNDDVLINFAKPVFGDAFGERYRHALNVLRDEAAFGDTVRVRDAVAEAADQGQLASVIDQTIAKARTWRGETWADRADEFDSAVWIAKFLVTSSAASTEPDLRVLTHCYRAGSCPTGQISYHLSSVPVARRPAVEALARDMAKALRAGEVAAWMPTEMQTLKPP